MPRRRHGDPDQDPQPLRRQRRVIVDRDEPFLLKQNVWILPHRGDIPFLRLLDDALDGVNVVALDITIGETHFHELRRLDRSIGHRMEGLAHRIAVKQQHHEGILRIPLRIVLVIG